ncbi:gamma-mobile-trio integrase GmtZ [Rheinheimera salexigens]|uniref:Integrase n=1 Tax=Rheinheimera salexigens TaxID=1628148 RepID=A0A1E7Q3N2_9GAMM|nr:VPA1269 family protein [Rheinheimera salexigens]OEY68814.1 integrase [Rheinheimera salexigens]
MIKPKALRLVKNKKLPQINQPQFSFTELKKECKKLGIINSVEYRKRYKDIPGFPAHPQRIYASEWESYIDFFDIKEFISYQNMIDLIHPLKLKNRKEYVRFIREQKDPTLPHDPQGAYVNEWMNWYRFLGKEEPFKVDFITAEFSAWAEKITEFMKQARGGGTKVLYLCRFVRFFIERYDKSHSPEEFLTQKTFNLKPFRQVLDEFETDNLRRSTILFVNQFLDFVIEKYLTIEDEDTGEIVRVMDARNPLSLFLVEQSVTAPQRTETTKPCLPYHFVKKAQNWIIPADAKNFRDLKHLQKFDADWVKVDRNSIDKTDLDCVYKKIQGQYYLWIPIDWVHTYALTKVPLRGRQIAYNDSGEADEYIAELDEHGKIRWQLNDLPFAEMTKNQSFIKKMPDNGIGMFVTTNKTQSNGSGYSIPWIPEDLAYWMVKLRKWQQKYNPINQPTSWLNCVRTSFNEAQLKAKGINCFLFRAYQDVEPKYVTGVLTPRLAATLYFIQPSNLILATLEGNESTLAHYSSKFTPHSMRVSLITAYVLEMGMPIEIVMKVVGHSSVVMSIYYTKVTHSEIRTRLEEGEKVALKSQAEATQKLIEQNKIEEIKNKLIGSNDEIINSLTNELPAGNFVFRDYGICPFAASRCDDGGEMIGATQARAPAPSGYLGMQNCLRCRHFITGPAFLGGIMSVGNEISLQSNIQSRKCHELQEMINQIEDQVNQIDKAEYVANLKGAKFDSSNRDKLESNQRRIESDYEGAAKKLDMLLCDLQSAYALIRRCMMIVNKETTEKDEQDESFSLLVMNDAELQLDLEEVSYYQQLQEVCENATIYQSATSENAVLPRTQILDRMAIYNNIAPVLFMMTEKEQLRVGNELFKLLKNRLKTWTRIEQVVNCEIKLDDLLGAEQISQSDIKLITKTNLHLVEQAVNDT